MPTVSVIIPLYNKSRYVMYAMNSVFAQTFEDYELIIVDDGSTDDGPQQVLAYSDLRLRLIRQTNAGPGAARNRGITEANGKYIAFLDADDEWLPTFLEESITVLRNHTTCVLSTSTYFLGEKRTDVSGFFQQRGIVEGEWELTKDIPVKHLAPCIFALHSCSTVCEKDVLIKYGGFYSKDKCSYGEDYYLWLIIILNCRMYRIARPLWWYHTENSEIGIRKGKLPLHPFMENPAEIRDYCPLEKRNILELWFALFALSMSHEYISREQIDEVEYLLKQYPLMKRVKLWSYIKLMLKLNVLKLRKQGYYK